MLSLVLQFSIHKKRVKEFFTRGEGYNSIIELSFWHPGGTFARTNMELSEN